MRQLRGEIDLPSTNTDLLNGAVSHLITASLRGGLVRRVTNNEEEIRRWATRHAAHPVERAPFRPDSEPAQLAFVFGEAPGVEAQLRPMEWSRFFAIFHLMGLVLSYDEDRDYELLKVEGGKSKQFEGKPLVA